MKELSLINCRIDKRYDVRETLGRGSYAEIYLARDILASPQSPHSQVVIKALNVFLQDDLDDELERTLVENFQNEAASLDLVRHPNIISRIGHGTARDLVGMTFHYLVLEYMPGGDLQNAVRKGRIPVERSIRYVEQVCAGLAHAHDRGVIHRDIKPHNLLLSADHETVKIADFGVARLALSDSPITRVGTNIYAPPEHSPLSLSDAPFTDIRLTPAADIYSLAKSVYTLITGEAPRAFANNPIPSLPDEFANEEWSEALLSVVKRATKADPRQRQQSVGEFWDQLADFRLIVEGREPSTVVVGRSSLPQPHLSRGYTPVVPEQPQFEPLAEPFANDRPGSRRIQPAIPVRSADEAPISGLGVPDPAPATPAANGHSPKLNTAAKTPVKHRRALRRVIAFAIFISVFGGILYGTHAYMRGAGIIPEIYNPFKVRTAVANTDIYLRPQPNTDNDPIGLVTKNSKMKIVNSQNNWYQVDIIEQGRTRPGQLSSTRGWLNGKYIDIDDN
jgi:serine/threonine protein kinase